MLETDAEDGWVNTICKVPALVHHSKVTCV